MISVIRGVVADLKPTALVVDVSGVGFLIACSLTTSSAVTLGQEATIYTAMVVREDSLTLYGFTTPQEREAFQIVQSVTGVGPKTALAMTSALTPSQLRRAVLSEDLAALSSVPGIGRKGAQRLAIELKDKVQGLVDAGDDEPVVVGSPLQTPVIQGLENLGYSTRDAQAAWDAVAGLADDDAADVGTLLKAALRTLARG